MATDEERLEAYLLSHSHPESASLRQISRQAHLRLMRPRMLSGHLQGQLLRMLCALKGAKKVLEIGTYTAYASLAMAEALPDDGELHTIERDDEMEDFIRQCLALSPEGKKVHLHMGEALELLPELLQRHHFDLVFIDANKREYIAYYTSLIDALPAGALLIADNTLWDGKVLLSPPPTDEQTQAIMAFNDMVAEDPRVEVVMLPLRDGLSLIRKR